jgi:hypothetical protein
MPEPRLPELLAIPAKDFHLQRLRYRGRAYTLLRFSQAFANIGEGPLQVRRGNADQGCPGPGRAAGYQDIFMDDGSIESVRLNECMVYHPKHEHWHIANVARYDLIRSDHHGRPLRIERQSDKVSFCLFDEHRLSRDLYDGPKYSKQYTTCDSLTTGITPGWADEYSYRVYGQWVNFTGLSDGYYYLRTQINPSGVFREITKRNNTAWTLLRISGRGRKVSVIANSR